MNTFILIQDPNKQNQVKAFTEESTQQAINYAVEIFVKNYKQETDYDIYNDKPNNYCYSKGEIQAKIAKYIRQPNANAFDYQNNLYDFVYIFVVKVQN